MDSDQLKRVVQAKQAATQAAQVLWNARLEILVASGRLRDALDHLTVPVEEGANNCDCNRPCGVSPIADWLSNPEHIASAKG